jgi:hypothetical protein
VSGACRRSGSDGISLGKRARGRSRVEYHLHELPPDGEDERLEDCAGYRPRHVSGLSSSQSQVEWPRESEYGWKAGIRFESSVFVMEQAFLLRRAAIQS